VSTVAVEPESAADFSKASPALRWIDKLLSR
jgi:hypothetical protein